MTYTMTKLVPEYNCNQVIAAILGESLCGYSVPLTQVKDAEMQRGRDAEMQRAKNPVHFFTDFFTA